MNRHRRTLDASGQNQITEGVIWKQLLLFFFPILFGTFFQQLYNTADAVVVGRFVGKEALAAVGGPTGTLINLLIGIFVGLSSGIGVIISQFYGAKKESQVSLAVHTAAAFSLIGGIVLMFVGFFMAPSALKAMGTPDDIMEYSVLFLRIYFLGAIPNLFYNMGAGILRAAGNSRQPLYFLIVSCFTNIGLDLLFVAFFHMGVGGAAIATVISQFVSAVLVARVLLKTDQSYRINLKDIRIDQNMLKQMTRIGFPAALQSVMYSSSNVIIQAAVNSLGTDTIAAWTAYSKIDSIFWMIISAFGIAVTTFVGQNYGAGKKDRVYKGIRICMIMGFISAIVLSILLYYFGSYIYLLFTADRDVIEKGMEILHFLSPVFFTYVCIEIYSGSLRGVGDSWIPMIITALGICVLRIIWILVAVPIRPGIRTMIFSYPLTWVITSLLFIVYFNWFSPLKRLRLPRFGHSNTP